MTVQQLRKQHPRFVYQDFDWSITKKGMQMRFRFIIEPDIVFEPTILIHGVTHKEAKRVGDSALNNFVFHLGLIESLGYWKATCSPEFVVAAGPLTDNQKKWWLQVLHKGMGEFFYQNGVDNTAKNFVELRTTSKHRYGFSRHTQKLSRSHTLVPFTGGKDSLVTLEMLRGATTPVCMQLRSKARRESPIRLDAAFCSKAGCVERVVIERRMDPRLFQLEKKGFLKGHTPFSVLLAFTSVLVAALHNTQYVAFSNERSSEEGNVRHKGQQVNHQWSKSFEFEKMFREYVASHLTKEVDYFSALRPLHEIQIAERFTAFPEHLPEVTSCNRSKENGLWCGQCAKCLSTFLLLSPFVRSDKLIAIVGSDLLDDVSLLPLFKQLVLPGEVKPFECVGTKKELQAAAELVLHMPRAGQSPKLLQWYKQFGRAKTKSSMAKAHALLREHTTKHFIPSIFADLLKRQPEAAALRVLREELADERILILGFAREGISTYELVRELLPQVTIGIADIASAEALPKKAQQILKRDKKIKRHLGATYLKRLKDYTCIIKAPGVSLHEIKSHLAKKQRITSQTQLFFTHCPGTVVGITGTKGKSTTASLITHVLGKAGFTTYLVGNVGVPAFDMLRTATARDLFVYELSSYQLSDIRHSPHVAVVLGVTPDHLDYHKTFASYVKAKSQIALHQKESDVLLYDADNKVASGIAKQSVGHCNAINMQRARTALAKKNTKLSKDLYGVSMAVAIDVAELFRVSPAVAVREIARFEPLEHRLELVGTFRKIVFYNDSAANAPQATIGVLQAFGAKIDTIMLGGFERGVDFSDLITALQESSVRTVILFPESGMRLYGELLKKKKKNTKQQRVFFVQDMRDAVGLGYAHTRPGRVCILSPAAPSFGMFKNYEERGEIFKKYVTQLATQPKQIDRIVERCTKI